MAPTSCQGNSRFWIWVIGVSRCASPSSRRSIIRTSPRNRHRLRTWIDRNIPKKLGASSRRYWLPGRVPSHSKNSGNGGGHISGLNSRRAALIDAELRAADAAVGPILVVAVRAGVGQLVAEIVHLVDTLAPGRVV